MRIYGESLKLFRIRKRLEPKHQIPAKAGAQVFAQRHHHGCPVPCNNQPKSLVCRSKLAPAIVQGKDRRLLFCGHFLNIVDRDGFRMVQTCGHGGQCHDVLWSGRDSDEMGLFIFYHCPEKVSAPTARRTP